MFPSRGWCIKCREGINKYKENKFKEILVLVWAISENQHDMFVISTLTLLDAVMANSRLIIQVIPRRSYSLHCFSIIIFLCMSNFAWNLATHPFLPITLKQHWQRGTGKTNQWAGDKVW